MEQYYDEVAEQAFAERLDHVAAESRLRDARPFGVGAPDQMSDTPLHRQDPDKPEWIAMRSSKHGTKQAGR